VRDDFIVGENIKRRWLRDFLLGYVAGLAFFWSCFFWLTTVSALGWFILQFYLALYFAAWAWFCGLMRRGPQNRRAR
jgi:hypothetical protein